MNRLLINNKALIAVLTTVILIGGAFYHIIRKPSLSKLYKSPVTAHSIEVWAYGELYAAPGDTGSGPGFVLLKDGTGKILEKKPVDLVISIAFPRWSKDKVQMALFTEWSLAGR